MINKIKKQENKIIDFILKHYEIIMIIFLIILSLLLRFKLLNYESRDYTKYLKIWFDTLKENNGILGLGLSIGNYNPPYVQIMALLTYLPIKSLYLIKIVSIIFDYLLVFLGYKLINNICDNEENKRVSSIIGLMTLLFLPTLVINGSMWAQCDVIYTFFVVLSLYFLQKDKTSLSFISLGVAFSFKLQTVFIIPAYLIIYLKKRNFSIFNFLWLPIMNIILSIPSILMGKSITDIFEIYFKQTGTYKSLTLNFPNIYNIINFNNTYFTKHAANIFGISITLAILAIILYLTLKSKKKLDYKNILQLSIISILICIYFLPHMHERYMFLAGIISIIYACSYRKGIIKCLGLELISLSSYFAFLSKSTFIPNYISAIILLVILISYIKDYLIDIEIIEEKGKM